MQNGFLNGFRQLRVKDVKAATLELWKALGINNRATFRLYLKGLREMRVSQAENVKAVFKAYGITKDIWGNEVIDAEKALKLAKLSGNVYKFKHTED